MNLTGNIEDIALGTTHAECLYLGNNLIWENAPTFGLTSTTGFKVKKQEAEIPYTSDILEWNSANYAWTSGNLTNGSKDSYANKITEDYTDIRFWNKLDITGDTTYNMKIELYSPEKAYLSSSTVSAGSTSTINLTSGTCRYCYYRLVMYDKPSNTDFTFNIKAYERHETTPGMKEFGSDDFYWVSGNLTSSGFTTSYANASHQEFIDISPYDHLFAKGDTTYTISIHFYDKAKTWINSTHIKANCDEYFKLDDVINTGKRACFFRIVMWDKTPISYASTSTFTIKAYTNYSYVSEQLWGPYMTWFKGNTRDGVIVNYDNFITPRINVSGFDTLYWKCMTASSYSIKVELYNEAGTLVSSLSFTKNANEHGNVEFTSNVKYIRFCVWDKPTATSGLTWLFDLVKKVPNNIIVKKNADTIPTNAYMYLSDLFLVEKVYIASSNIQQRSSATSYTFKETLNIDPTLTNIDYEIKASTITAGSITVINGSSTATGTATTTSTVLTGTLADTTNLYINCFNGDLYYIKLYNSGTLIADYRPCINSYGQTGLIDLITGNRITFKATYVGSSYYQIVGQTNNTKLINCYSYIASRSIDYIANRYITFPSGAYFNLGFTPANNVRYNLKIQPMNYGANATVFGCYGTSWSNAATYALRIYTGGTSSNRKYGYWYLSAKGNVSSSSYTKTCYMDTVYELTIYNATLNSRSVKSTSYETFTLSASSTPGTSRSLYLGMANGLSGSTSTFRLYYFDVYYPTTSDYIPEKMHLIPAKIGNEYCLYETNTRKYYYNIGSGTLTGNY